MTSAVMLSSSRSSVALHREGRQFLREHVTATYPHNPGLQFSNIIKTAPLVPFINGPLPVPPPVSINLPIVIVRYDAPWGSYCTLTPYPALPWDTSPVPMVKTIV